MAFNPVPPYLCPSRFLRAGQVLLTPLEAPPSLGIRRQAAAENVERMEALVINSFQLLPNALFLYGPCPACWQQSSAKSSKTGWRQK